MNYKNIIFDFGNVIGTFDETYILKQFCTQDSDVPIISHAIFENWQALDEGTIDYNENTEHAVTLVPKNLQETVRKFFSEWSHCLQPIPQTWELIRELKKKGARLYILSNASVNFAENADFYEITKEFDGIVFSGVIRAAKPEPKIYHYLFDTYHLNPAECFFIDDRADNIAAGKALGMDGIVFTGDVSAVKNMIF